MKILLLLCLFFKFKLCVVLFINPTYLLVDTKSNVGIIYIMQFKIVELDVTSFLYTHVGIYTRIYTHASWYLALIDINTLNPQIASNFKKFEFVGQENFMIRHLQRFVKKLLFRNKNLSRASLHNPLIITLVFLLFLFPYSFVWVAICFCLFTRIDFKKGTNVWWVFQKGYIKFGDIRNRYLIFLKCNDRLNGL